MSAPTSCKQTGLGSDPPPPTIHDRISPSDGLECQVNAVELCTLMGAQGLREGEVGESQVREAVSKMLLSSAESVMQACRRMGEAWTRVTAVRFDKYPGVKHAAITVPGLQLADTTVPTTDRMLPYCWPRGVGLGRYYLIPCAMTISLDWETLQEIITSLIIPVIIGQKPSKIPLLVIISMLNYTNICDWSHVLFWSLSAASTWVSPSC